MDLVTAARTPATDAPALPAARPSDLLDSGVRRSGQAPLLTFYDDATGERTELSWATFENWVAKTANLLVEELELEPGDRVATVLGSSWTTAVITVACWRVGLVVVPADADGPLAEIRALLAATTPRAVCCREDLLADLPDLLPDAGVDVVAVGTGLGGRATTDVGTALPYAEEVLAFGDHVDAPAPDPTADAVVVWSAIAGAPFALSQEALVAAGAAVSAWGVGSGDRLLLTSSLQVVEGLAVALTGTLTSGASLVLVRHQTAAALLPRVTDERVTLALPRGADLDALADAELNPDAVHGGFRGFLSPAGAPDAVVRDLSSAGWVVRVGHGVAEAGAASSFVPDDLDATTRRWLADAGAPTVGVASAHAQVAVFDGGLAAHGVEGEVRLRGPVLTGGYLDRPDLDAAAFAGGWFATGDLGRTELGPDGREHVFLSGRR